MSGTVISSNPSLNRGLLSVLLPLTFISDFELHESEIVCKFTQGHESILPQVQAFLDALGEITESQFYFEMQTNKVGFLKIYDSNPLLINEDLRYEEVIDCEMKDKIT